MESFRVALFVFVVVCVLTVTFAKKDLHDGARQKSSAAGSSGKPAAKSGGGTHSESARKYGSRLKLTKPHQIIKRSAINVEVDPTPQPERMNRIISTPRTSPALGKRRFVKRGQGAFTHEVTFNDKSRTQSSYAPNYEDAGVPVSYRLSPTAKNFITREMEDNGDRFYYNDYYQVAKDQVPMWRINDISIPDPRYLRREGYRSAVPPPYRRPVLEQNACKQYLEFLKYAFEQLDSNDKKPAAPDYRNEDYYYYDGEDEYAQTDRRLGSLVGKRPTITANKDILYSMTLPQGQVGRTPLGLGSKSESLPIINLNETDVRSLGVPTTVSAMDGKLGDQNRRTPEPTITPFTHEWSPLGDKYSVHPTFTITTVGSEVRSRDGDSNSETPSSVSIRDGPSSVTEMAKVQHSSTLANRTPQLYHVGVDVEPALRSADSDSDGCHDKIFPCPDRHNVTYPVNGFCNRFVVCESGKPNPEFCHEGLHFNLVTKQCDLPHNSFCTYSCPKPNGYFGIPGDCGGFFRCVNWYPEYRMCPPRMHWDFKAKICAFEELSPCPLKCEKPFLVKPYNGVCNSYVICTRGVAQYHKCPDGMHFNQKTLTCIHRLNSKCTNDENFISRNRGIGNGLRELCANIELKDGKTRWCQVPSADYD